MPPTPTHHTHPPPPLARDEATTLTLKQIAIANNINKCANLTGIAQNRAIGIAFETWVLKTSPFKVRQAAHTGRSIGSISHFVASIILAKVGTS